MEFRYALKGPEPGTEVFVDGVVLAREYLGRDPWHVWDMRPGRVALCKPCSSEAERIITHASGSCPKIVRQADVAEVRVALAREAIDARSRLAAIRSGQEREELDEEQEDEPEAEPGAAEAGHEHSAAAEEQVALVAAGDVDGGQEPEDEADDEVKVAGQSEEERGDAVEGHSAEEGEDVFWAENDPEPPPTVAPFHFTSWSVVVILFPL